MMGKKSIGESAYALWADAVKFNDHLIVGLNGNDLYEKAGEYIYETVKNSKFGKCLCLMDCGIRHFSERNTSKYFTIVSSNSHYLDYKQLVKKIPVSLANLTLFRKGTTENGRFYLHWKRKLPLNEVHRQTSGTLNLQQGVSSLKESEARVVGKDEMLDKWWAEVFTEAIAQKNILFDNCGNALTQFIAFPIVSRIEGMILNEDTMYAFVVAGFSSITDEEVKEFISWINNVFATVFFPRYGWFQLGAHTKAALGSIMSRNGSHNIGSHVLAALSHNVGTMPDDRVLYQYIQHRMDYIATATTEFPQWTTPTMFVAGLMKNFYTQKHLLDYISRSEGLRAYKFHERNLDDAARMNQHGTIRIFIRKFFELDKVEDQKELPPDHRYLTYDLDDKAWSIYYFFGEKDKMFRQKSSDWKRTEYEVSESGGAVKFLEYDGRFAPDWRQDVRVAIPGGIVGQHAFYTIIENVVRNAAKHGWTTEKKRTEKDLEINIDFYEDNESIVFTVGDNVSDIFGLAHEFWISFFKDFDTIEKWDNFLIKDEVNKRIENDIRDFVKIGDIPVSANGIHDNGVVAVSVDDRRTLTNEQLEWKKLLDALDIYRRNGKQMSAKWKHEKLYEPVSGLLRRRFVEKLSILDAKRLEVYLQESQRNAGATDNLPIVYRILRSYLLTDNLYAQDEVISCLTTNMPSEILTPLLGRRLIVALHHDQQRKLSQPFVGIDGKLRKENWGLAEMKISAGYLAQREPSEIGGLDEKGNDIIVPVAMPGVCRNADNPHNCLACSEQNKRPCYNTDFDCPLRNHRFHLGYRFRIAKPQDVLVILVKEQNLLDDQIKRVVSVFSGEGIHFAYARIVSLTSGNGDEGRKHVKYICYKINEKGDVDNSPIERFSYRYVVVPGFSQAEKDKTTAEEDVRKQFGFRCITLNEVTFFKADITPEDTGDLISLDDILRDASLNLKANDKNCGGAVILRKAVLSAWIRLLAHERCKGKQFSNKGFPVRLVVNVDGNDNGSERGLVTVADLLRTMFVECYHTALISFLKNPPPSFDLSDTTKRLVMLLSLIKVMPEKDKMEVPQQDYGHGADFGAKEFIRKQLVSYCDLLKSHLLLSTEFVDALKSMETYGHDAKGEGDAYIARKIEDIDKDFEKAIARRLFRGKYDEDKVVREGCEDLIAYLRKADKSELDGFFDAFHGASDEYKFPERDDSYRPGRHSFEDNLRAVITACSVPEEDEFNALVESLNSMFLASDVYLRKYEERIATLPEAYKHDGSEKGQKNGAESNVTSLQEIADYLLLRVKNKKKTSTGMENRPVVKYSRHDKSSPENAVYSEALSGSQSYLNALARLVYATKDDEKGERYAAVARLLENAFLRILIIDERVMNFVNERSSDEMIKTFINMGIWVADVEHFGMPIDIREVKDKLYRFSYEKSIVERNGEGSDGVGDNKGEKRHSKYTSIPPGVFDVLIIHQGIIDKWWDRHDKEKVEKILNDLRKSIPRVVVTTGRGRPENIPDTEKVLPFSVIESSLFRGYPEKLILVNTVMNLLPYGNKEEPA